MFTYQSCILQSCLSKGTKSYQVRKKVPSLPQPVLEMLVALVTLESLILLSLQIRYARVERHGCIFDKLLHTVNDHQYIEHSHEAKRYHESSMYGGISVLKKGKCFEA